MVSLVPLAIAFSVFVLAIGAVLVLWWLGDPERDRSRLPVDPTPFAGGHAPQVHAWNRYHARYYPMALVFLAFDMEMVFMYPWAVVFVSEGLTAMIEMGMFIVVLLLGILYAWREHAFEWT